MNGHEGSALSVAIVEDEARLRELLVREITAMGHTAVGFHCAERAQSRLAEGFDVLILDLNLPRMAGMELFRQIRDEGHDMAVVILTGFGAFDSAVQAVRWKAEDYLTKPCSLADIDRVLSRILARRRAQDQLAAPSQLHESPPSVEPENLQPVSDANCLTLEDMQRLQIIKALERHDGNKPAVAEELGISLRTLYNRLNEYRLQGFLV